ncbi:ABC transporter permease subunit [Nocardioides dubius]|uniref:ABC transporter permease n=1 Tax=Nocardioides dubius TaxID=317019 RepID=A0ABN1U2X2_9ACTN
MNPTIVRLAVQALLGHRRFWLLLVFPIGLAALVVLIRVLTGDEVAAWDTLDGMGPSLVLPLLALIAASSVMGPEVDDGSIVYLLAKPISRHSVALSKYLVALAAVLAAGTLPILVVGLVVRPEEPGMSVALWTSTVVSGIVYTALFLALSTLTRHAVVFGLLYILIWEGTLGSIFSGIATLSVAQWGQRVGQEVDAAVSSSDLALWWALGASAALAVGAVWFAGDRLRSFSFQGDE